MKRAIILLCALFYAGPLVSQTVPQITDGETVRYKRIIGGNKTEYDTQRITLEKDQGETRYKVTYLSPEDQTVTLIRPSDLMPLRQELHVFKENREYRETTEILSPPLLGDGMMPIIDMGDLTFLLRFFPFEDPEDRELFFLNGDQGESGDMVFRIVYAGEERITVDNKIYDTYKLELETDLSGPMRLFASMIPETAFWFSKDPSRTLVRFIGSQGMGKENSLKMELVSSN